MTLLSASPAPRTVCPQARQQAAPRVEHAARLEQLAPAHRRRRLLVDVSSSHRPEHVVIDPRDVAAALVLRLGGIVP